MKKKKKTQQRGASPEILFLQSLWRWCLVEEFLESPVTLHLVNTDQALVEDHIRMGPQRREGGRLALQRYGLRLD